MEYCLKNNQKYFGKVSFIDGKPYGTLINSTIVPTVVELKPIETHDKLESVSYVTVWKDKNGIEHTLDEADNIYNDNVIAKKYEYKLPITIHEAKEDEYFYTYNGQRYTGEVIERDGKFYGEILKKGE